MYYQQAVEEVGAADLLQAIANPQWPVIVATDVAAVFAHPDDETIACGAQLARLRGRRIFTITDGAPRNLYYVRRGQLGSVEEYAATRRAELLTAMRLAGVPDDALHMFGIADQASMLHLSDIAHRLVRLMVQYRTRFVLTHSYEGGHPDHDATAFAVHAAAAMLRRRGRAVSIIEAPLYRMGPTGRLLQSFAPDATTQEVAVPLTSEWRALKRRMLAAHESQRNTLRGFSTDIERFRLAPDYNFSRLPNGGRVLYDTFHWSVTSTQWLIHAAAASRELGLEAAA